MSKHWAILVISLLITQISWARTFKIKQGQHSSSGLKGSLFLKKSMKFKAKFYDSAEYYLGNINQLDTNKLYGFSDCWSSHQKNSARYGWRWNDQSRKLEILAYTYANSIRSIQYIDSIELNKEYTYKINIIGNQYEFQFNGKTHLMPRGCNKKRAVGYRLYPYFGGDEVAPHDIKIRVRR